MAERTWRKEFPPGSGVWAEYNADELAMMRSFRDQLEAGEIPPVAYRTQVECIHALKAEFGATVEAAERDLWAAAEEGMVEGMERVDRAADPMWRLRALNAVERTCQVRADFISDDIWDVGQLPSTVEDRALGPVLLVAKNKGWCEKTGELRPSVRSHLSGKPVWKSLIFIPQQEALL